MWTSTLTVLFYILLAIVHGTHGDLYCYQCADVSKARDCSVVKKCGPNQVCYSTQSITSNGQVYRKMGCRDVSQCSTTTGIVGKRFLFGRGLSEEVTGVAWRSLGDTILCDACCNSNLCQPKLCNDEDYMTDRGPICFHCDYQTRNSPCTSVRECARGEACTLNYASGHHDLLQSGCMSKSICERIVSSNSFHKTNSTCFTCCAADVCNTGCNNVDHEVTASTTPSGQLSTRAGCSDSTHWQTCKLAASIVCKDLAHARNANCEHYCGFC
ncbi:uncharacterized protein LOC132760096 [Ruditapes philippinarum]|uniref:uncharacterized protein LOC132760096 n=1 Tax=Ruditapes philippinarum TaxID=129788 RepID=UPI00295AC1ED|nr:uncharacterized protein LOC132760096 [Ruditapes philippinarum]